MGEQEYNNKKQVKELIYKMKFLELIDSIKNASYL